MAGFNANFDVSVAFLDCLFVYKSVIKVCKLYPRKHIVKWDISEIYYL